MSGEELAFLNAHFGELTPADLQQLKPGILAEKKRREAEASTKTKGSGELPTAQCSGRHPGSAGRGGELGLPEGPPSHRGQAQSQLLDLELMKPATRRPGHCPEKGPHLCLHRQKETPPKFRWFNPPPPRANKPR
jgi:hypothetical protein